VGFVALFTIGQTTLEMPSVRYFVADQMPVVRGR
jgi:hypothetical protein